MQLPATKYPNTIRTVTGLVDVYPNDVVLNCNTAVGTVTITLPEIPSGYWSTQYVLYIVDANGNAGTNNITINAGSGQTINGQASVTINVNNGACIVSIIDNAKFAGNFTFSTALAGIEVQDAGVTIVPSASVMNFIGQVTVTDVLGVATIDVTNNFIQATYAQLATLINNQSLIPNQNYQITNAEFGSTPIVPTSVFVKAITNNSISLTGEGIFYNADYQGTGNYAGVTGFNAQLGEWTAALTPTSGDVVIWNNYHYVNITGSNGVTNPNADVVNWTQLPLNTLNGYILAVDTVLYDSATNHITYREDARNNRVYRSVISGKNSLNYFKWGSDKVTNCSVENDSVFACCNAIISTALSEIIVNENSSILIGDFSTVAGSVTNAYSLTFTSCAISFPANVGTMYNCDYKYSGGTISNIGTFYSCSFARCEITLLSNASSSFSENVFDRVGINIGANTNTFSNNYVYDTSLEITSQGSYFRDNTITNSVITIGTISAIHPAVTNVRHNIIHSSTLSLTTVTNNFEYNEIIQQSSVTITTNSNDFSYNVLKQASTVTMNENAGDFTKNTICNGSFNFTGGTQGTVVGSVTTENRIENSNVVITDEIAGVFSNNVIQNSGYESEAIASTGIVSDNEILNGSTLTLTQVSGTYQLNSLNSSTVTITTIASTGAIKWNYIIENSTVEITSIAGGFYYNTIKNISDCTFGTISAGAKFGVNTGGRQRGCTLSYATLNITTISASQNVEALSIQDSSFTIGTISANITGVDISQNSSFNITTLSGAWSYLRLRSANLTAATLSAAISNGIYDVDIATIGITLDCSDLAIFNAGVLTIPSAYTEFGGYYFLTNASGITIDKISGISSTAYVRFYSLNGSITFNGVAVAGAVANEIVSPAGAGNYIITFRSNGNDFIVVQRSGTFNVVTQSVIMT